MTRENHPSRWILIACSTLLAACGGGGWSGKAANLAVPDKTSLAQACAGMAGKTVSSGQIGLTSGRATVSSAVLVPAVTTAPAFAEYCRVQGSIAPLTTGADPIRFQLNLPTTWNEKAVMVGGGGFNGTIVDAVAALRDAAPGQAQPITQGFDALEKEKVSQRFYRHPDTKADGNGLGLSIVKQVCAVTGYTLQYDYQQGLHIFSIIL